MQLNTVVLPAPFGPISAVISPRSAVERQIVDGDDAAEAHRQMLDVRMCVCCSSVALLDEVG